MRLWLVEHLECPACRGKLALHAVRLHRRQGSDDERVNEGVLECTGCAQAYPIVASIPRLVPPEQLTAEERDAAGRFRAHQGPAEIEHVAPLSHEEVRRRLERMLAAGQQRKPGDTAYRREWFDRQMTYVLDYAAKRQKHAIAVRPYLEAPIRSILEIGGGTGGFLKNFRDETGATRSVLVEILEGSCQMALVRDPDGEVIRGDAYALPFADGAFDLAISAMVLEHLTNWQRATLEMVRVSRQAYIAYSPNGAFPYDHGHVDAPVHAWMPLSLAVSVAYLFNRLKRTGRTREILRRFLSELNLLPRRRLARFLRRHGVESKPLFERLMRLSLMEERPLAAVKVKRFLRACPWLASHLARALVLLGMEPIVCLYLRRSRPLADSRPA